MFHGAQTDSKAQTGDDHVIPLPIQYMADRVPIFHDAFTIPQPSGRTEGMTFDDPISLPMITLQELGAIQDCLFGRYVVHLYIFCKSTTADLPSARK